MIFSFFLHLWESISKINIYLSFFTKCFLKKWCLQQWIFIICSVFRLSQKSFQINRRKSTLPYFHFDPILDLLQTSLLFLINIQWCLFLLMLFFYILNVFYPFKLSAFFQEFLIFEVEFCICLFECFKFILIILTLFSVKPLNFVNFLQEFVYKFTHFR